MSDESGVPSLGVARKKKIAIGVIFTLSPDPEENSRFQDFFFSHFPLFESHMNKLKSAIEQVTLATVLLPSGGGVPVFSLSSHSATCAFLSRP